jgi:hypothetical protein
MVCDLYTASVMYIILKHDAATCVHYLSFHKIIHDNLGDIRTQCDQLSRHILHYSDMVVTDKDLKY